jgi:TRAP-type transport system periplasmic protein
MRKIKGVFLLFMVLLISVGLIANGQTEGSGEGKTYTLRLSHAGPVSDANDDYVGALALKDYIEKNSSGRVVVEIYAGSQLGNYQENMEQLNDNILEAAHTSVGAITPFVPGMSVIDLQYILPNDEVVYKLMEGDFVNVVADEVKSQLPNVKLVAISDGGRWRSFYTTNTQIKTADDLNGLKIRTINSPIQMEFVKALKGAPTPISWGEVYTALATGLVDGTKNATPDIMSNKFNESINYGTLDRHTFLFGFYFLSEAWLNSLPEDLQKVVLDGFTYAAETQTKFNKDVEDKANADFEAAGGVIYEPTSAEKATFYEDREKMIDWYKSKYGTELLDQYLAAVEDAKKEANYQE